MIRRWLPVVALALVAAVTASLGTWQLRRGQEKDALQQARDLARATAPIAPVGALDSLAPLDGRRVALEGRFDDARTVFLDNRTRQGVAGFHVLTPMRLDDGGAVVMVLRGWIARDPRERTRLPAVAPTSGSLRIEGFAQATLPQPFLLAAQPEPAPGDRLWQHYDAATFRRWSGLPVAAGVVRQTGGPDDGLARDWVEPGSGADKHRAYAFQWFAMAVLAAIAAAVALRRAVT
jgi:cytochrome oxidase assembly protein ShyY1